MRYELHGQLISEAVTWSVITWSESLFIYKHDITILLNAVDQDDYNHDVNFLEDEGQGEDNFIHVHDDIDEWCYYIFMNLMYFES